MKAVRTLTFISDYEDILVYDYEGDGVVELHIEQGDDLISMSFDDADDFVSELARFVKSAKGE